MPVDWTDYDSFAWSAAKQSPLDAAQKTALADWAAGVLELKDGGKTETWGHASPPGRYAATVIRIAPRTGHRFASAAAVAGIGEVGIKLFKTTADVAREARKLIPFHARDIGRLPGLPNPRVQRSLAAGTKPDGREARGYVVQEWVAGTSLEDCLRRMWREHPIDAALALNLIEQLFARIVIPLWRAGTVWWDIRDANFCIQGDGKVLRMIDVDSLAAYAAEILRTPERWEAREKGRATALARLRRMSARLLGAARGMTKSGAEKILEPPWVAVLEPELKRLGRKASQDRADDALQRFLAELESAVVSQSAAS